MTTPLNTVKERFESKAKLVSAVETLMTDELWLPRLSSDRGGKRGLKHVSNTKLIKLHDTLAQVKEEFGSRAKLIDAILTVTNRSADAGYRTRLDAYPAPRLCDMLGAAKKAAKKAKASAPAS